MKKYKRNNLNLKLLKQNNKMNNKNNFVTFELQGGCGNQLFGIYTAIAYSLKFNKNVIFKYMDISPSITHRITYWNSLFKNLKTYTTENIHWNLAINENTNSTYDIKDYGDNNVIFKGYFQSYFNFIDKLNDINKILDIEGQKQTVKEKYNYLFDKKNIGIHFRMGDYKHLQQHHPLLKDEYYINSLKNINIDDHNIYVFCEKEDDYYVQNRMKNILNKVGNPDYPFKIIKGENDIEELFLLSLCDNIVIANSTFSWWSAIFSGHNNICVPCKWFHNRTEKRLTLPDWKIIEF